jgi:hypothetical protein
VSEKECERCGAGPPTDREGQPGLLDFCLVCSQDLCDDCMREGCCGNTPAKSGNESFGDE